MPRPTAGRSSCSPTWSSRAAAEAVGCSARTRPRSARCSRPPAETRNRKVAYPLRMAVFDEALIGRVYAAFNARDIDGVLEHLDPDVDWPNAWEGGRVRGHEAVRDYWTRQWREIDRRGEPQRVSRRAHRRLAADAQVVHVYTIRDGLIVQMDVEEPPDSPATG